MTERVRKQLEQLRSRDYMKNRTKELLLTEEEARSIPEDKAYTTCLIQTINAEQPVFLPDDRIGFHRYREKPAVFTLYGPGNITINYGYYLKTGLGAIDRELADAYASSNAEQRAFIDEARPAIDAVLSYCRRLHNTAEGDLRKALETVPEKPATNYHEALVMLKFIHYTLRLSNLTHLTLGRFDQYMYPYYKASVEAGMTRDEILELTEEFFISLNVDTDLYCGIQKGDNGQSLVLGGIDMDGNDQYNELSDICMDASLELNLIDPKINLRVGKHTPFSLYLKGTKLTKQGLGFPQYCNDDVVIPGLIALGYAPEDAYNYAVAACWEYIVPGKAYDIPNINCMDFPRVVREVMVSHLKECADFSELMTYVRRGIDGFAQGLMDQADIDFRAWRPRFPYFSLFFDDCLREKRDYSTLVTAYNAVGFHGVGLSNGADALAAVKRVVFDEKSVSADELLKAMEADFEGYEELRHTLLACPKMGNNDDYVDSLGIALMDEFACYLYGKKNPAGSPYRAGTGSAMNYIYCGENVGATADGRHAGEPFASSYSPALTSRINGPLSVIQSFTKFDLRRAINGGPLTLEIHDTTFRNEIGDEKVARLVKSFIELGGHQLQLNAINRDRLLDAKAHPERYPNLIVRVWGWSGYFNELDECFQNHIIARTEFSV